MSRTFLLVSALGLAFATSGQANPAIPYIPSQWPAAGAFDKKAENSGIVSRGQARASTLETTTSTQSTRQDR
jgi:hypothetical protein